MIELVNVSKKFGNNVVLDRVSLRVEQGETLLLLGPSGCGKSVLLKHIIGIMQPDTGQVLVEGVDITDSSYKKLQQWRRKIGVVFQNATLFDSMTVYENMVFALKYHNPRLTEEKLIPLVKEKLAMVGLRDVEHLYPSELSGGMQKRISIARALMHNPEYMFYDEPTTGLDPIMSNVLNHLIRDISQKMQHTSIIVTHDINWALNLVDKVALLYDGKIRFFGSTKEFKKSDNPYVRQFLTGNVQGPIETFLEMMEA